MDVISLSNIRIAALGGLGEDGKNMYVVEVDEQIFVLDAGLKNPSQELYGVDAIIPDVQYLVTNLNRVCGIFLTHGHDPHIGALPHIFEKINVPIYGTKLTNSIALDSLLKHGFDKKEITLKTIKSGDVVHFKNKIKISFFSTTHNIPESVGIAIHTLDGVIVYTSNFTFDQNVTPFYQTSFSLINEIASKKVLCLMLESLGSLSSGNTGNYYEFNHRINSVFSGALGRIIISLYSSDLLKIQKVINMALEYNKKIAIIGRKTQRIVDVAINEGYLEIPNDSLVNLRYIDDKNKNKDSDLVVLVVGGRHEPFYMLQRMCRHIDRLIHIDESDDVIVMTEPIQGTEKMAARTIDILYRTNARITVIDKKLLSDSHADLEEAKLAINLLKPKYVMPVIGEYRHQYAMMNALKQIGYDDHIIMADNGNVIGFTDGVYKGIVDSINVSEVLIDGAIAGDINDVVLKDRELLAEDGVMLIVVNVNPKTKKVVSGPEIISRGFVYVKDSQEMMDGVKKVFDEVKDKHLNGKYINWSDFKNDVKSEVNKYLYKETKRNPITIPVIISTES